MGGCCSSMRTNGLFVQASMHMTIVLELQINSFSLLQEKLSQEMKLLSVNKMPSLLDVSV